MSGESTHDDAACARVIVEAAASRGGSITASTKPPLVAGPYAGDGFKCPHGVMYWVEPTGEQIARWAAGWSR